MQRSSILHELRVALRDRTALIVLVAVTQLAVLEAEIKGVQTLLLTAAIGSSVLFGLAATMELSWRLYGRRNPDALQAMAFPPKTLTAGQDSFDLIVCARDEPAVIRRTLTNLAQQTHPHVRIIVSLIAGDEATIAESEAAREDFPERIIVLVREYPHQMKPHQLNTALALCEADYVGVIDAEDETAPGLVDAVEAAFQTTGADVVQGPVQLMNLGSGLREWFCVHNVMEYFFWFSSRMMYQARHGFVPLGGNTVFIRRALLEDAQGWPVSLTEDCALGVKLCTDHDAKVVAYYAPEFTTHEETPDTVSHLIKQRVRWDAGFGSELMQKKWWALPSWQQRLLAWYILATPFLQAATIVFLPLALLSAVELKAPIALAMVSYLPFIPLGVTVLVQLVGLRDFGKVFNKKVRLRHYVSLGLLFYPYQLVLALAAARAVVKIIRGDMHWFSPDHSNKHRVPAATGAEEVA